jgi:ribosomal protein L37E
VPVIFLNPRGAPELACDECGCRWFDRMTNSCYECGAPVTEAMTRAYAEALAAFGERRGAQAPDPAGERGDPSGSR